MFTAESMFWCVALIFFSDIGNQWGFLSFYFGPETFLEAPVSHFCSLSLCSSSSLAMSWDLPVHPEMNQTHCLHTFSSFIHFETSVASIHQYLDTLFSLNIRVLSSPWGLCQCGSRDYGLTVRGIWATTWTVFQPETGCSLSPWCTKSSCAVGTRVPCLFLCHLHGVVLHKEYIIGEALPCIFLIL